MNILQPVGANFILLLAAMGFGSLLLRLFPENCSPLDRLVLALLGGFGILGTVLFCVGQVWFTRSAILLVLFFGILLGLRPIAIAVQGWRTTLSKVSPPFLPATAILVVLLVTAIGGLALPTGDMNNDSIAYHYLGPKVWLREGLIRPVPDEVLTYFPVVIEAQYAALMSLGGDRAPGLFAIIGLASILLMSASLAMRLGLDQAGAWWVVALVAAMPAVYRGIFGGFLDAMFACFVLAAARLAFDADEPRHYMLFGMFCGITMGTKYTGIVAWVVLVFCSLLVSVRARPGKTLATLKWLTVSCVVAAAMASPFYLRNWILYGCPIYPPPPGLLKFFNASNMTPAVMQELLKNVTDTGRGMGGSLVDFLLLPFNLTYHTSNFRGAGGIGILPWALGPFGVAARRRDNFAIGLLLFAVLQTAAWFATAQVSRYLIPVYIIGAIFGVIGWNYAASSVSRIARSLSAVAVAISIFYGLFMIIPDRVNDMRAALSRSYEAKRWHEETPRAASFDYINHEPSVKKILILNRGIAAYFIDKPYIKPFGRWGERTLPGVTNVAQVMSELPNLQATHILDVIEDNGSFSLGDHPAGLTLVFEHDDQRIYRID